MTTNDDRNRIKSESTRRQFIVSSTAASAGFWLGTSAWASPLLRPRSAMEKINFGCIGVGGKGTSDSNNAAKFGNISAICDIDDHTLAAASKRFPSARQFHDYREMLDAMGDQIDAVTVSIPDHNHAPAAVRAMKLGKHCFCQKPMTHTISEARLMANLARDNNLATQMGNQGTASDALRRSAAILRSGALGPVREVHVWTNRPVWPQGCDRPPVRDAPAHVHWNLWLGPAPHRPDGVWKEKRGWGPLDGYHPFNWRGWWDFGTGALGDMACHTLNMPFMGLDLRNPVSVEAEHSGHNKDSYPNWSTIRYEFPATSTRPALALVWYDGGKTPPEELFGDEEVKTSGSLIIGRDATLYAPGDNGTEMRIIGDVQTPEVKFEHSPGHFAEYARAIETGNKHPAVSNFDTYAGPLTETVLLGNLAVWSGKKVQWDADSLRATNAPELETMIRKVYPDGWGV